MSGMISTATELGTRKLPDDPYKGLPYYEIGDEALFAGRDDDVVAVSSPIGLGTVRLLLLHGMTGCGKSSFLRAGLIPTLETEIAGFRFMRDEKDVPAFVRSTDNPTASLARSVHQFVAREYKDIRAQAAKLQAIDNEKFLRDVASEGESEFLGSVERDPRILVKTIERLASYRPRTLVLVIDQAEEVVTLKPGAGGEAARIQFFDLLGDLSRSSQDFKLIIAFRTEYHGQFYAQLRYSADVSRIADYFLADLARDQIIEAIVRPTSRQKICGYPISPRDYYGFEYDEGLPEQIADALLSSGVSGGVLPALQIVCRRLYESERAKAAEKNKLVNRMGIDTQQSIDATLETESPLQQISRITFKIQRKAFTDLGGIAGQVDSYLQNELDAAVRQLSGERTVKFLGNSKEIVRWRKVLSSLVKPQANGTVTTDVLSISDLQKDASERGCIILPQNMFGFLADEKRRILRGVAVTSVQTKNVIPCYSLGHDVLASALQAWYERDKLERKTVRTLRIFYGAIVAAWVAAWFFSHRGFLLFLAGFFLLGFLSTFASRFRATLVRSGVTDMARELSTRA